MNARPVPVTLTLRLRLKRFNQTHSSDSHYRQSTQYTLTTNYLSIRIWYLIKSSQLPEIYENYVFSRALDIVFFICLYNWGGGYPQ